MVKAPKSLLNQTKFSLVVIIPLGCIFFIIYSNPQVSFEKPSIESISIYISLFLVLTLLAISFKLKIFPVRRNILSQGEFNASVRTSNSFTAAIIGFFLIFSKKLDNRSPHILFCLYKYNIIFLLYISHQ